MIAVDAVVGSLWGVPGLLSILDGLQAEYGDAGPLAFLDELLPELRQEASCFHSSQPLTADELAGLVETVRREQEEKTARNMLRVSIVFDDCKRLRRGLSWVQESPPAGHVIMRDACPTCEKKSAR